MTTLELELNMLAEATTTEISKQRQPENFEENRAIAREGGEAAGIARKAVEERTRKPVSYYLSKRGTAESGGDQFD